MECRQNNAMTKEQCTQSRIQLLAQHRSCDRRRRARAACDCVVWLTRLAGVEAVHGLDDVHGLPAGVDVVLHQRLPVHVQQVPAEGDSEGWTAGEVSSQTHRRR